MQNKRILIIVDLQNDFIPEGALAVNEGDRIIPLINKLQEKFDLVVATQDWHPEDHASFAKVHGKQPGDVILLNGMPQVLWPVHCVQNTWGARLVSTFDTHKIDRVFFKGVDKKIDSYSAIYDNAKLRGTGLEEYLLEKNIQEIFIAGLATDYCVKYTALDAHALGYSTTVILDACRGVELTSGDIDKAIEEMKSAGIKIVFSKEFL
jgi:nicotinamidase/pyrazinamidase